MQFNESWVSPYFGQFYHIPKFQFKSSQAQKQLKIETFIEVWIVKIFYMRAFVILSNFHLSKFKQGNMGMVFIKYDWLIDDSTTTLRSFQVVKIYVKWKIFSALHLVETMWRPYTCLKKPELHKGQDRIVPFLLQKTDHHHQ